MTSTPVSLSPTARRVAGPSALGGDVGRFAYLAHTLAVTDFKLRFFGSMLGYFWQLVRPMLLFGVLYVVFTQGLKLGEQVPNYPVVLLMNIVLYTYFAEGTSGAVTALVDREILVRKIQFPRLAIPMSIVLTATFNLALNLIVVLIFMVASGVNPRASWLWLPLLLVALALYIAGFAMLVSSLYVRFRDMRPIWDVVLQVMLYATPVIYTLELIEGKAADIIALNPLASILQQARHVMIDPNAQTAVEAAGGWGRMLIPIGIAIAVVALGALSFKRAAPRIAEEL
jgi:ABC-2 type transport system permease protein